MSIEQKNQVTRVFSRIFAHPITKLTLSIAVASLLQDSPYEAGEGVILEKNRYVLQSLLPILH
jgi:hypothetical protein